MVKSFLKKRLSPKIFYQLVSIKNSFFPTESYLKNKLEKVTRRKFYSQFIKEGDLVFDIGANYGSRTETFINLNANVVSVEPNPDCVKFLKSIYGNKVILIAKGLGEKEDILDFYVSENSALSTFSQDWINNVGGKRFAKNKWLKQIKVPVTTLDQLIKQFGKPHFIKIDVEGLEFEVLKGLSQKVSYLSFEYAVPEKKDAIVKCINQLSFYGNIMVNFSIEESMSLNFEKWINKEDFLKYIETPGFEKTSAGDIYIMYQ